MYTINHQYKDENTLINWLEENEFKSKNSCLVQFFCGVPTRDKMVEISAILTANLPLAHILGVTTDGEIFSDSVTSKEIVISVSVFEKTTIKSAIVEYETNSYNMGESIAKELDSIDSKAMILFTTGLYVNGEQFMNGVGTIANNRYPISGGMTGDNGEFKNTFVSLNGKVISKGSVGIVLNAEELSVYNHYHFGWEAIGLPMKVTKSNGNQVFELDGMNIIDVYKKYFGESISNLLPKVGVEIPLILTRKNKKIARACINKLDDGSLIFAGDLIEGEEVRFGIGSADLILKDSEREYKKFKLNMNLESIFVYSCMARRRLLANQTSSELEEITKKANVSGFFTYGEFFSDDTHNYLFNETMVILAISEEKFIEDDTIKFIDKLDDDLDERNKMIYAITHMTNVIAKEWQEKVDYEVRKNKEQERNSFQKNKLAQMGEMISMIAHQWRQPLNAISATGINLSLLSSMEILEDAKVQESSEFIQNQCQKMSSTIDTFMNFVKPSKESKEFKLSDTLDSIMQIMGTQLTNHNIDVKIEQIEENISLVGYEDLLEQVIINLLSNSRDAFDESTITDKYINIKIAKENDIPVISVEDNAGGIEADVIEKIFNPYFTTKEQGKGTGLGLYMSRDIMKKSFGGDLVYKLTEHGSIFDIKFGGGEIT